MLNEQALDVLFRQARTHNRFSGPVSDEQLKQLYDLLKWAPTSANCSPMRVLFLRSEGAKQRLRPALLQGNLEKTMLAPVVALIAYDIEFYENLPRLFPHTDARAWFIGNAALIQETAFRNSSLQGAYLILAARAIGLDCGPMSGFDQAKVNAEFFPDGRLKANFLCNLGRGDPSMLYPRHPRLEFSEVCQIL